MRTRKEVEDEQQYADDTYNKTETVILHTQALQLEVLLDIRELLSQDKEMQVCGFRSGSAHEIRTCMKVNCKEHPQFEESFHPCIRE